MRSRRRFHDPSGVRISPELLHKDYVVAGQNVSHRHDVKVDQVAVLVTLRNRIVCFLHIFAKALDVLHHAILSGQFKVVGVMIEQLRLAHPVAVGRVEHVLDGPGQRPVDVPLLAVSAGGPTTLLKI